MTECTSCASAVGLAELYANLVESLSTDSPRYTARTNARGILDPLAIEEQCTQIDELWYELGWCVQRWNGYCDEFIATRFANMHYVNAPKIGNAYPDDAVWRYLVDKIHAMRHGKIVIMYTRATRRLVRSWN